MIQDDLLSPVRHQEVTNFVSAKGAEFIDKEGKSFIDLDDMCIVLGQSNSEYINSMTSALNGITSGKVGLSSAKQQLYKYIMETTNNDFSGIHLTVSGSEAVEWAVKLAKKMTGKTEIISFWNSIHGRTHLSASISGLPKRKTEYGPLVPGIVFAPYPNCCHCPVNKEKGSCKFDCIRLLDQKYEYESAQDAAAVIVEPYQGAGIIIPPEGYFKALYDWAKSHGMLFIMDEIQSGMGRTGKLYCYQELGIQPDMLLLGKALGNGMHISALLVKDIPSPEFLPALTGGVGDDVLACTAACQVFSQLKGGLLEHVYNVGQQLKKGIESLADNEDILEARCAGLAAAVEFKSNERCVQVWRILHEKGFLAGRINNAIYVKPPYVITEKQIEGFLAAFKNALESRN
jgi:4-aminobutyrate aminotransferase-like enzyme